MDHQQKQRVMLGLCAAMAVGTGGYFVVFRDSPPSTTQAVSEGPSHRRVNASAPEQSGRRPAQPVPAPESRPEPRQHGDEVPEPDGTRRPPKKDGDRVRQAKPMTAA